ncbi:MAG: hypothetical protein ACFBSD_03600 [Paracoccaceae bacterium]
MTGANRAINRRTALCLGAAVAALPHAAVARPEIRILAPAPVLDAAAPLFAAPLIAWARDGSLAPGHLSAWSACSTHRRWRFEISSDPKLGIAAREIAAALAAVLPASAAVLRETTGLAVALADPDPRLPARIAASARLVTGPDGRQGAGPLALEADLPDGLRARVRATGRRAVLVAERGDGARLEAAIRGAVDAALALPPSRRLFELEARGSLVLASRVDELWDAAPQAARARP